jgi:hypothetical protein
MVVLPEPDTRDVREIPQGMVRDGAVHRRRDGGGDVAAEQGVAVRRRLRDEVAAEDPAGAGAVLDDDRVAERSRQLLREAAADEVAAGREWPDQADRPRRPRGLRALRR